MPAANSGLFLLCPLVEFPLRFDELTLHPRLQQALAHLAFDSTTDIQRQAIPLILAGHDIAASSKTGSGKTLAFLLPILSDYCQSDAPFGVLLLYPTKALSRDQEGTLGALLTGFLATAEANPNLNLNLAGIVGKTLWLEQLKAMGLTVAISVIATVVIAYAIKLTIGLRPDVEDEVQGLDLVDHGEQGYHFAE